MPTKRRLLRQNDRISIGVSDLVERLRPSYGAKTALTAPLRRLEGSQLLFSELSVLRIERCDVG